jgi:hypothetical protein
MGAFTARQRSWAVSISLNAIASPRTGSVAPRGNDLGNMPDSLGVRDTPPRLRPFVGRA